MRKRSQGQRDSVRGSGSLWLGWGWHQLQKFGLWGTEQPIYPLSCLRELGGYSWPRLLLPLSLVYIWTAPLPGGRRGQYPGGALG